MKKIIVTLLMFFSLFEMMEGQITYQYSLNFIEPYVLPTRAGTKLVNIDYYNDQIVMYNLNNTIYKLINVPPPATTNPWTISYISLSLFDTDSTNIEYMVDYQDNNWVYHTIIYEENGTTIFSADSCAPWGIYSIGNITYPIFNTDSGTFMMLQGDSMYTKVYQLPGKLYCANCDGSINYSDGILQSVGKWNGWAYELKSFPNPSKNATKVYYTLPQGVLEGELIFYDRTGAEIKQFRVGNNVPYIELSTADIPSGTYLYRIQTSQGLSQGKKQVVIH